MNLKEMITDGTIVKFRDGRLAVALKGIDPKDDPDAYIFYGVREFESAISRGGIIRLDSYDDHLDAKEVNELPTTSYDIMAIKNSRFYYKGFIRILFGFGSEEDILWDWKREDVIEVTMEAVEEKFGCKVKIVKEEN